MTTSTLPTLVINAPHDKTKTENKRSFASTLAQGIGEGYAINSKLQPLVKYGCKVILLCKDLKLRAEGTVVKLVPVEKAKNGIQRYDVHMRNLRTIEYAPERLGRTGVAVLDK